MPGWRRIVRIAAIAAAVVAYPILAHLVAAAPPPAGIGAVAFAVAPLIVVAAIVGWRGPYRMLTLGLCAAACAALWIHASDIAGHLGLVYFIQNICTNAALGLIFGRSLAAGREPLCTHLATMVRGPLQPPVARYTRQVTVAWTIFFAAMIAVSALLFIVAPIAVWSAFANLLSMPLVAAMFIAEFAVRKRVLPDLPRTHVLESLRAYWSSSAVPAAPPGWRRQ
ncbi:MAG: hypothetical protein IPM02_05610 [Betaproteobacteria bacterium]|nr:hypothetical protein [Betaproteobacteria bacterium]